MSLAVTQPRVVVVGAGPGGFVTSLLLTLNGVRTLLIDQQEKRSSFTKALTLQPRTLELLAGLGLVEALGASGNKIDYNHLWHRGKRRGTLSYKELPSACNYLLSITQPETERILEEALLRAGGAIYREVECVDIDLSSARGCHVSIKHLSTGVEERLEADYVVAADGGRSSIRSWMLSRGMIRLEKEERYRTNFIMGDFTIENYPFERNERHTFFGNNALCVFIPMVFPQVRIVAFGLTEAPDEHPSVEEFDRVVKQVTGYTLDLHQGQWLSRFYPSRFLVNPLRVGPLFFIGDAGHIISPIGAQGINLSIEDGYNLGWKLGMVLGRGASHTFLDAFASERSKAAWEVMEETNELHKKLSHPIRNFFFMHQLSLVKTPSIHDAVLLKQTQFDLNYGNHSSIRTLQKSIPFYPGMRLIDSSNAGELFSCLSPIGLSVLINTCHTNISPLDRSELPPGCDLVVASDPIDTSSLCYRRLQVSAPYLVIRPDRYVLAVYSSKEELLKGLHSLSSAEAIPLEHALGG